MTELLITFGIILLVMALFLVIAVLLQHGKAHNLSGTIAGGAETFFGKTKGTKLDKILGKTTTVVAILFVVVVMIVYVVQPDFDLTPPDVDGSDLSNIAGELVDPATTTAPAETTPAPAETTTAPGNTTPSTTTTVEPEA